MAEARIKIRIDPERRRILSSLARDGETCEEVLVRLLEERLCDLESQVDRMRANRMSGGN